jgi:hypothetical protein
VGTRSGKAMRVVIFAITMLLFLYACTQPLVEEDTDWFECEFSKDGKFLVCHERKRTETAGK